MFVFSFKEFLIEIELDDVGDVNLQLLELSGSLDWNYSQNWFGSFKVDFLDPVGSVGLMHS